MPTSFAVILEGQVVISVAGRTVGRLGPGDCLGYEAMREAAPAERTARALTDVRVMVASRSQFRAFAALTLA
jgi:CRP-like cAMP-binding protein